jgi:hypothetical protein
VARRVFFSFHYQNDSWRVWQVRNHNQFKKVAGNVNNAELFMNRDNWESVKSQGDAAIKQVINEGMKYTSVTVVLIGEETYDRKYVKYEIERSEELGKGMLGVYIGGLKDSLGNYGVNGPNPFYSVSLSKSYPVYDWVSNDGYNYFSNWVEQAAIDAGL